MGRTGPERAASGQRVGRKGAPEASDPDVFISDRIPLERYPEALDQFAAGVGRKIVVVP